MKMPCRYCKQLQEVVVAVPSVAVVCEQAICQAKAEEEVQAKGLSKLWGEFPGKDELEALVRYNNIPPGMRN